MGRIELAVTEEGFEPKSITVKKDQPVNLVVTRKTERTCATAIVIDEYDIKADLPLNQPVTVTFTPTEAGQIRFGCAMKKMISGTLIVQ